MTWSSNQTRFYESQRSGHRGGEHSDGRVPWTVRQWRTDKHRVSTVEQCDDYLDAMRYEARAIEKSMTPECFVGRGRLRTIAAEMEAARGVRMEIMKRGAAA